MADKIHNLKLTRGGITIINQLLLQTGWTKNTPELYRGAQLIEQIDNEFGTDKDPVPPQVPDGASPQEVAALQADYDKLMRDHVMRDVELQVTEKEREAIKVCLKHHVAQGAVSPTKHFLRISQALGLHEE